MYQGKTVLIPDFSGGQNSNTPVTELALNEAVTADNIVLRYNGKGFRQRYGDTVFNSTAMNSGASVHGLGYFKDASASQWLVAVSGNKIYSSSSLSGTMSDITGAVTVTAGTNNHWTQFTFNNVHLGFGGPPTSPDAPWKYTGSGNASALGGTPPSAYGGFQTNNRVFAFRTASNPSTIYWSVLSNEADWTGAGSGSSDVSTKDNDSLTAAAVLNTNTVLLFKENSVYQMQTSSAPFPVYPLFSGVGCAGKHAVVVADGVCYFVNNQGRMRITDGVKIYDERDIPALAKVDDLWASLVSTRFQYIQGVRRIGIDYDHIIWSVTSTGSTNNLAIVWDLKNKCWLQNTTGYKTNIFALTQAGTLYGGHTDGKVYLKDDSSAATDASESSAAVVAKWTSGWISQNSWESIHQPRQVDIGYRTGASGSFKFYWGFDFNSAANVVTINTTLNQPLFGTAKFDQATFATTADTLTNQRLTGRGNVFQYQILNASTNQLQINGIQFSGKSSGQKVITAQ